MREAVPGFYRPLPVLAIAPVAPARGNGGRVSGSTVPSLRLASPAAPQASSLTRGDAECCGLGPDAAQGATPQVPAGARTPRLGGGADAAPTPALVERLTCRQPGLSGRAGPGRKCRAGPAPLLPGRPRRRPLQAEREARQPLRRPRTHVAARTTGRLTARPTHADARRRRPAAETAQPASHTWGRPTEVTSTLTHLGTQAQAPTAWWTLTHVGHTPQNTDSQTTPQAWGHATSNGHTCTHK